MMMMMMTMTMTTNRRVQQLGYSNPTELCRTRLLTANTLNYCNGPQLSMCYDNTDDDD